MPAHKWSVLLSGLLAACLFLTGCAGVPKIPETQDPVLLLPSEAEVYVAVCTPENRAFVDTIIDKTVPAEQAARLKQVVGYTDTVYAAADSRNRTVTLVAKGSYPVFLVSMALSGKKEWKKVRHPVAGSPFKVSYYQHESGIQVAFPDSSLCIVSLSGMDDALTVLFDAEAAENAVKDVSAWFSRNFNRNQSLAVYSTHPEKLTAAILKRPVTFGIAGIGLQLSPAEKSFSYNGLVEITLSDARVMPAALVLMKTVMLFMDGGSPDSVESVGNRDIVIKNFSISADSMIELIGSGIPVTGF